MTMRRACSSGWAEQGCVRGSHWLMAGLSTARQCRQRPNPRPLRPSDRRRRRCFTAWQSWRMPLIFRRPVSCTGSSSLEVFAWPEITTRSRENGTRISKRTRSSRCCRWTRTRKWSKSSTRTAISRKSTSTPGMSSTWSCPRSRKAGPATTKSAKEEEEEEEEDEDDWDEDDDDWDDDEDEDLDDEDDDYSDRDGA